MNKRKICVILVDRANYGRMKPVMKAILDHPGLELQTVCAGTMLLERFGDAVNIVKEDGFKIDSRVYMELEGSVPATMAKSVGFAVIEFASELQRLDPDVLLLIGDRYEALAAAMAAAYQNVCIAHIQGGEVSGSIDECARHAITKFAHFHFPATERAQEYLIRMGEDPATVFNVGCPVGDYINSLDADLPQDIFSSVGVGAQLNPDNPFFLVIFHPVTTEYGSSAEAKQVDEIITALDSLQHPTAWLWPNIDAGSDHISKSLRRYREFNLNNEWLHLIKNLSPELFQKVLKRATCAIGNSSSFIRDSSFSGTPVVLAGERQLGREVAENVMFVKCEAESIKKAIEEQCGHGRYQPSGLYGNGTASSQIADALVKIKPFNQKRLHYIFDK
ncbi:UDP-N-acetylglucosamine 2-epimerase [Verrucomicrobiota bacterium]